MYTLKSIARRGTSFGAAVAMLVASVGTAVVPAMSAYADALNPLTDRSLTLSSSSPGWSYTDGSQNATYAPPNSGANGQKSGNTFSFKTSTAADIKAFTFQYCTTPAGSCTNPGNDTTPGTDTPTTSDLNVHTSSPAEVPSGSFGTIVDTNSAHDGTGGQPNTFGSVIAVPGYAGYNNGKPGAANETGIGGAGAAVTGNFVVYNYTGTTWVPNTGWSMAATPNATGTPNANNYITLTNTGSSLTATPGMPIKVVFFGTANNYITNPGAGAFFVRMNTYSNVDAANNHILDGGVTVANVMNQSIWIQTKVLETMEFSVGTVDPNSLDSSDGNATAGSEAPSTLEKGLYTGAALTGKKGNTKHGICDRILGNITPTATTNVLKLGDQTAESSLRTDTTYSTHSYWRLSSNSSAGATVYYSGHTLTNTVGDEIRAIGPSKSLPHKGSEQFGLALDNSTMTGTSTADLKVDYTQEATTENGNDNSAIPGVTAGLSPSTTTDVTGNASWHDPTLYPLIPAANYNEGYGDVNTDTAAHDGQYAFVRTSDTIPEPLASENNQVVDCVTGKMRYVANIAATTPAGIYTTKVNYIAAPQY